MGPQKLSGRCDETLARKSEVLTVDDGTLAGKSGLLTVDGKLQHYITVHLFHS